MYHNFNLFGCKNNEKRLFLGCLIFVHLFWKNHTLPKYDESTPFFVISKLIKFFRSQKLPKLLLN